MINYNENLFTKVTERQFDEGVGVEVLFYDGEVEIGRAYTVEHNGKSNSFLHNFFVKEKFRNKGYGSQILRFMIEMYNVDTLYVDKNNEAIRLYKRFGFKEIDRFDDMIIMHREGSK